MSPSEQIQNMLNQMWWKKYLKMALRCFPKG
uniref:p2C69 n=1 Tax=Arundo donax TaxID=35708 RepID=A0A0A9FK89_ARUDO